MTKAEWAMEQGTVVRCVGNAEETYRRTYKMCENDQEIGEGNNEKNIGEIDEETPLEVRTVEQKKQNDPMMNCF